MGGEEGSGALAPRPEYNRVKNFLYHLIYVSKAYIPNLRLLGPPLHVEKFVWWKTWAKLNKQEQVALQEREDSIFLQVQTIIR